MQPGKKRVLFSGLLFIVLSVFLSISPTLAQSLDASGGVQDFFYQGANRLSLGGIPLLDIGSASWAMFALGIMAILGILYAVGVIIFFFSIFLPFRYIPRENVLTLAWRTTKRHIIFLGIISVASLLIGNSARLLEFLFQRFVPLSVKYPVETARVSFLGDLTVDQLVYNALVFLLMVYVTAGIVRISVLLTSGGTVRIKDFFVSAKTYFFFLIGTIIYKLLLGIGLILLVIPGIIVGSVLFFWQYRYIERGGGLIEAFRESIRMTRGAKKEVFLFWFLAQAISLSGYLFLFVGHFFTYPLSFLALAYAYRALVKRLTP
ncbi:MAG: hypothetical protein Q8P56_05535 [Candidatus Uhrbacteria bacterium]|nr:hypothetical protein [Candidatus Uhrbacteria bacterium]